MKSPSGKKLIYAGEWTAAGAMLGKLWAVPNTVESLSIPPLMAEKHEQADRFIQDESFFYVVGRWLGDGWVLDSQRPGRPDGQNKGTVVICEGYRKAESLL